MAFACDDVTRQALARIATDAGWRQAEADLGGVEAAIERLTGAPSPDLLVVDFSDSEDPMADLNSLADVCEPGTCVIAIGNVNDVKLYRSLVTAGVAEYLVKPVMPADLLKAVAESSGNVGAASEQSRGKLVMVTGARGGVGASTVATSLAWVAGEKELHKTAFVDLDLRFGTGALSFDVEPGTGVSDVLDNPDRVDPLFLERASIPISKTLSLFATEAPLDSLHHVREDAVAVLADELLRTYEWVIMDVPRDMFVTQHTLIQNTHSVVLVCDRSLASMRDGLRVRNLVREWAPEANFRLVGNTVRPPSKGDLAQAEFEKAVDSEFACILPYDRKAVGEAARKGQPLAAVGGKVPAGLRKLAIDITGESSKGQTKSWLSAFTKKKTKS
jgi:pilus assembly protein CpaE